MLEPTAADLEFNQLEGKLWEIRSSLFCALQAFRASEAAEVCETASPAINVLFSGVRDLELLLNELDKWHLQFGQHVGRQDPEVSHG